MDAKKIVVEGDVGVLVDSAKTLGDDLARQLTTSQIRNVFGEVRRIDMNWPVHPPKEDADQATVEKHKRESDDGFRKTVLLQPRLAYLAAREKGQGVRILKEALDPCLVEIRKAPAAQRRLYFARFVDFFEAILAYHKAAGGN